MSQSHRSRGRFAVLAAAFVAALAFAVPSAAQAASLTQTDFTLKTSWVNYISNPLWKNAQPITTSWTSLGSNTYAVPVTGTSSTVRTHSGSIAFDVDLHDIHVTLANLTVTGNTTTGVATVSADVTYDPVSSETIVSDRRDVFTFPLTGGVEGDDGETTFTDRVLSLTAGGAQLFNGGSNGSYAAGQAWGDISVVFP
ncbi:MAG TPA: HtaA domain-containing protein [Solirubrobacteraceae bacterium]|nr:HtaA domain-containing protein [Solirubrobacteraceae bacterium]